MVLAVVEPFCRNGAVGIAVCGECVTVKVAYEILSRAAAEGADGFDIADEDAFLIVTAVDGKT
ncbi:MAG: hypothetical protein K2M00_01425, partial [Muribaculaceae bacterium]|nr:hypothetical protein [Muribaculaceae bacterium]